MEKISPQPVRRDGKGKSVKDYSSRDWLLKVQEEVFEVAEFQGCSNSAQAREMLAEELTDVITVCISWLETARLQRTKTHRTFYKGQ